MALTVQQDGSVVGGQPNTAHASWWNDYHDLLTGVMKDQPVTIEYDSANPVVSLKSNISTNLLVGYETDGVTEAFALSSTGAAAFNSNMFVTYNSVTGSVLTLKNNNSSGNLLIGYKSDGVTEAFAFDSAGAGAVATLWTCGSLSSDGGHFTTDGSGNLTAVGLKQGSLTVALSGSHSAGQVQVSYGSGVPASLNSNEIYFQTS